jgi:glycosyltransferase involved in cell wall biosynthesis
VPVVGIVANLKPIKKIDVFLRAAARLKSSDSHFIILGWGPLKTELVNLTHKLGLSSRVHFYSTADQAHEVINLFDVGVLTSESEGLSNVLIEYALAGIPAVAFDTGGNNEVVVDGQTGYLVTGLDETALAERIDFLIENRETARKLGAAAQRRACEVFAVKTMIDKTGQFYLEILKRDCQDVPEK